MMKISNSKKELARLISENGGWRDNANWAAQDKNGIGMYAGGRPYWDLSYKEWASNAEDGYCTFVINGCNVVSNYHQTAISREEFHHLYPAPDADGWIEWDKGSLPVGVDCLVDVKYENGTVECGFGAGGYDWNWKGGGLRIIAYRLHKPEQECATDKLSSEAVSAAKIALMSDSIEELVRKPTIEQLAADYRSKLDYANRKQDEADKANMESDAALAQLEDAIAEIGFAITPLAATEKEPELVAAVKVGDQVECVESNIKRDKYNGMVGRLHFIDESDTSTPYLVDFGGAEKIWCHEVKFILRP